MSADAVSERPAAKPRCSRRPTVHHIAIRSDEIGNCGFVRGEIVKTTAAVLSAGEMGCSYPGAQKTWHIRRVVLIDAEHLALNFGGGDDDAQTFRRAELDFEGRVDPSPGVAHNRAPGGGSAPPTRNCARRSIAAARIRSPASPPAT